MTHDTFLRPLFDFKDAFIDAESSIKGLRFRLAKLFERDAMTLRELAGENGTAPLVDADNIWEDV